MTATTAVGPIDGVPLDPAPAAPIDEVAAAARPRLLAIAYRMLGSMDDAEDVVQEAIIKARRAAPAELASPVAYLTTVTTRTAIDHLRSARVRREAYVGPWLPEPVPLDPAPDAAEGAVLSDSLSMAFLVVLEALSPEERAVLILHDVFGFRHAEVAEAVGRSEGACRQLLRRARRHVEANRPRFAVDRRHHEELVRRFRAACEGGDLDAFLAVLAEDATFVSDGGAEVRAARRPLVGRHRIARFLSKVLTRGMGPVSMAVVEVNGEAALALLGGGRLASVVFVEPDPEDPGRAGRIHLVRNPSKLDRLRPLVEAPAAGTTGR